ncbi:hypothetical protein ENUP19_0047G0076 [Entamoeba nuttalli]|uniref:Uncharacterized protein n=2 Tax=Entamoeba nuttalli TaxID=412467 RepID=K2HHJ0_ENTNP|nr:hypothetical protein ENU1_021830 [Entamoeba nuttalli P19]EKE42424.1 hypothetical protein ENU1_021830 [Entamoeba nuttalli P19]|eukprot:XP_008855241.1 hypothetical protein ENU1_021830 [Entamoeba nuttalli P19]
MEELSNKIIQQLELLEDNSLNTWNAADEQLTKIFSKYLFSKPFQSIAYKLLLNYFISNYKEKTKSSKYAFVKLMLMTKYTQKEIVINDIEQLWEVIINIYESQNTSLLETISPYLIDLYNFSITSHSIVMILRNYTKLNYLITPIQLNRKSNALFYCILIHHQSNTIHLTSSIQQFSQSIEQNIQNKTLDLFLLFIKEYISLFSSMNWIIHDSIIISILNFIESILNKKDSIPPALVLTSIEIIQNTLCLVQNIDIKESLINSLLIMFNSISHSNIIASCYNTLVLLLQLSPTLCLSIFEQNKELVYSIYLHLPQCDRHLYIHSINLLTQLCETYQRYLSYETFLKVLQTSSTKYLDYYIPKPSDSTTIIDCLYFNAMKLIKSFATSSSIPDSLLNIFTSIKANTPWPSKVNFLNTLSSLPLFLVTPQRLSHLYDLADFFLVDVDQRVITAAGKTFSTLFSVLPLSSKSRIITKHIQQLISRPDIYTRGSICFIKNMLKNQPTLLSLSQSIKLISIVLFALEHSQWKCDIDVLIDSFELFTIIAKQDIPQKEFFTHSDTLTSLFTFHLILLSIFSITLFPEKINKITDQVTSSFKYPYIVAVVKNKLYSTLLSVIQARLSVRNPLLSFSPTEDPSLTLLSKVFTSLSCFILKLPECTSAYSDEILLHITTLSSIDLSGSIACMTQILLYSHTISPNPLLDNARSPIRSVLMKEMNYRDYVNIPKVEPRKITEQTLKDIVSHSHSIFSQIQNAGCSSIDWYISTSYLALYYNIFLSKSIRSPKNSISIIYNTIAPKEVLTSEWITFKNLVQQHNLLNDFVLSKIDGTPTLSTIFPLFSNIFTENPHITKVSKKLFSEAVEQENTFNQQLDKIIIGNDSGAVQTIRMYEGYIELLKQEEKEILERFTHLFDMQQIQLCLNGTTDGKEIVERMCIFVQGFIAEGCKQTIIKEMNQNIVMLWRLLKRESTIRNKLVEGLNKTLIINSEGVNAWKVRMYAVIALLRSLTLRMLIFIGNEDAIKSLIDSAVIGICNIHFVLSPQNEVNLTILNSIYSIMKEIKEVLEIPAQPSLFKQVSQTNISMLFFNSLNAKAQSFSNNNIIEKLYFTSFLGKEISLELAKDIFTSIPLCSLQTFFPPMLPFLFRSLTQPKQPLPKKYLNIMHLLPQTFRVNYLSSHINEIHSIPQLFFNNLPLFSVQTLEKVALEITTTSSLYFKFIDQFPDAPICEFGEVFDYLCVKFIKEQQPSQFTQTLEMNNCTLENLINLSKIVSEQIPYLSGLTELNNENLIKVGMGVLSKMCNKTTRMLIDGLNISSMCLTMRFFIMLRIYLSKYIKELPIFDTEGNVLRLEPQQEFSDKLLMSDFWDCCEVNSLESALRITICLLSQLDYQVTKTTTLDHAVDNYVAPQHSFE